MGYIVDYTICLHIAKKNKARALEIFNHLHTDEMLFQHANGGSFGGRVEERPVRERKWYSWVKNPDQPYTTLRQAFNNWGIVEENVDIIDEDNEPFELHGYYHDKLGQQDFLLDQLAPVLKNLVAYVRGEDGEMFAWVVENGEFRYQSLTIHVESDDEEENDDDEKKEEENSDDE